MDHTIHLRSLGDIDSFYVFPTYACVTKTRRILPAAFIHALQDFLSASDGWHCDTAHGPIWVNLGTLIHCWPGLMQKRLWLAIFHAWQYWNIAKMFVLPKLLNPMQTSNFCSCNIGTIMPVFVVLNWEYREGHMIATTTRRQMSVNCIGP